MDADNYIISLALIFLITFNFISQSHFNDARTDKIIEACSITSSENE